MTNPRPTACPDSDSAARSGRPPDARRRRDGHAPVQPRRSPASLSRGARDESSGDGRSRPSRISRGRRRADRDAVVRRQPPSPRRLGPAGTGRRSSTGGRPGSPARLARSADATRWSAVPSGRSGRRRVAARPSRRRPRAPCSVSRSRACSRAAVDVIVLETFSDLDQLVLAVDEARRASDVPVIASLTFGEELALADGSGPAARPRTRSPRPAPTRSASTAARARRPVSTRSRRWAAPADGEPARSIMPNAGLSQRLEGRFVYAAGAGLLRGR